MSLRRTSTGTVGARRQGGAYAVEFGLIFPVFFVLFYGVFAYGMISAMRLGLQHAAEEGARAALRYPADPDGDQIGARIANAISVATLAANWIDGLGEVEVDATICPLGQDCAPSEGGLELAPSCGSTFAAGPADVQPCQVVVTVRYPYDTYPVFPSIPGFGLVLPDNLEGRARLVIDGRALQL